MGESRGNAEQRKEECMDKQELLTLAGQIAGAAEEETALLERLCGAACADFTARLLPEADPAVSGAAGCAAARTSRRRPGRTAARCWNSD
jgi:hypothetical protein